MQFSNPRLSKVIEDYPSGGKRVACTYQVKNDYKKGYRVSRVTTGKPKYTTFSGPACIVDGDNGKTYILRVISQIGCIDVLRWDFLSATEEMGITAAVFADQEPEKYQQLMQLVIESGAFTMKAG